MVPLYQMATYQELLEMTPEQRVESYFPRAVYAIETSEKPELLAKNAKLSPLQKSRLWGMLDGLSFQEIACRECTLGFSEGNVQSVKRCTELALSKVNLRLFGHRVRNT